MTQIKKYALLFLITIVVHNAQAQDANTTSFSLQQAIEYAVKNSPNYLNAELDLKSADYRRKEITGLGLPQVSGSIDFKDYISIPVSVIDMNKLNPLAPPNTFTTIQFGTKYNATAGFSASQLIFSSDYIFGLKAQNEFMNLSKLNVTRSKADLISQVTKAYYMVVINNDRIKLLDANVGRLKKTFEDTKAANQQGFVELIDVERLEVAYNNLISEKSKAEKSIGILEAMLKFQMGYKIESPIILTDKLNPDNEDFQDLSLNADITKRPDYQLLQAQQNLYDLDVKRLKYSYLPTLSAYGSYQYNAQRQLFNFFEASNGDLSKKWFKVALVGATLNLNIFTGFQRVNKLEQAKITSFKNVNTLKNLEIAAQLEITSASITYNNAYSSTKIQKKNMDLAQHVYDVAQKKYQGGVGSNLEIVTAETSLKEAQTNYYNAVFDMIVAKIDYQKAIGTLVK